MPLLKLLSHFSRVRLCDGPIDGSPPGSPVPGVLQARTLEWVVISFSNAWKWKVKVKSLSCVLLLATPWTAAYQAPLPMGFSRQEYWSGLPLKALCKNYALSRVFIQQKLTLHFLHFWAFAGCWILFLKKIFKWWLFQFFKVFSTFLFFFEV